MIATATTEDSGLTEGGWAAAADPQTTVALYMGRDRLDAAAASLICQGRPPQTPAIAVENAGRVDARALRGTRALSDQIGRSTVSCDPRDTDRYGRTVAVCSSRGVDLNGWLVTQGWAVAYRRYSRDYVRAEDQAPAARRGVWSGRFDMP